MSNNNMIAKWTNLAMCYDALGNGHREEVVIAASKQYDEAVTAAGGKQSLIDEAPAMRELLEDMKYKIPREDKDVGLDYKFISRVVAHYEELGGRKPAYRRPKKKKYKGLKKEVVSFLNRMLASDDLAINAKEYLFLGMLTSFIEEYPAIISGKKHDEYEVEALEFGLGAIEGEKGIEKILEYIIKAIADAARSAK